MKEVRDTWRQWMSRALTAAVGVEGAEADNYAYTASRHGENKSILDLIDRFEQFDDPENGVSGVDRLRKVTDFTGIEALDQLSVPQLKRMEWVMLHPEEAAKQLAEHDVTVVMANWSGDGIGALDGSMANYEDAGGRSLFFGINKLGDIYRNMSTLHGIGIRPSTLVLESHSIPGQFIVTDERDPNNKRKDRAAVAGRTLVKMVTEQPDFDASDMAYSMNGMRGAARLVNNYMRPSRGIDDVLDDKGRAKIIVASCHTAVEIDRKEAKEVNEEGQETRYETFIAGRDSVISRIASDLAANGVDGVDVYGSPGKVNYVKTEQGMRPVTVDQNSQYQPFYGVRARVENGTVTEENYNEIILSQHKIALAA